MEQQSQEIKSQTDDAKDISEIILNIDPDLNASIGIFLEDLYHLLAARQRNYAEDLYDDAKEGNFSHDWPLIQLELCHYYTVLKDQLYKRWREWEYVAYDLKEEGVSLEELLN